ncbi:MAG: histidine kinase [Caldilineaceae bacterium]
MTIRIKLLILIVMLCVPLLVNLAVLGLLTRTVTRSVHQIQDVAVDQQAIALRMQAQLRDAEAALYRHQLEGGSPFAVQFAGLMGQFGGEIDTFGALAGSPQEEAWAEEIRTAFHDVRVLGTELIALREAQSSRLGQLMKIEGNASHLFKEIALAESANLPYQGMVGVVSNDLNDIELYIAEYASATGELDLALLRTAVLDFRRHIGELRALAQTPQEIAWADATQITFDRLGRTGVSLINGWDQQRTQFAEFTAQVAHIGQTLLAAEIQPYMTANLVNAQDRLFVTLNRAMLWSGMLSLLVVAVTLTTLVLILRRVAGDAQMLLQGADRVTGGDLTTPVLLKSDDELAQLGRAFNTMMDEIGAREQRLQQRIAELERLRKISLRLTSALAFTDVMQIVADSSVHLVNAAEAHIFFCDEAFSADAQAAAVPTLMASAGRDDDRTRYQRAPRADGLVARTIRAKAPQVVSHPRLQYADGNEDALLLESMAAASIPLLRGDTVIGVFNVILDDRAGFRPSELHILGLLADQATVALENAQLYQNVAEKEASLNKLLRKLALVQEEERRLVGLDLHDGLTQILLSANMHLNTLAALSTELPPPARRQLTMGQERLREAINEARWVVAELRPTEVEDHGLVDGLQQYVTRGAAGRLGRGIQRDPGDIDLAPGIESAVFRIVQEALANARKYAQTPRIQVCLRVQTTPVAGPGGHHPRLGPRLRPASFGGWAG